MKKISVAVLAAAMLAGTVTAADIGFSYKGSNYFKTTGSDKAYFDYQAYGDGTYLRADCLSVSLTTDVAGIVVDFDTKKGKIDSDEYYGWLNYGLPLGSLQLTGGAWSGRYVNRVVTDKFDLDKEEFELHKPGVINGTIGKDSDNLTLGKLGLVGAWTLADVLPGTLMVKLGIARYYDADWNKTGSSATGYLWNPDKNSVSVGAGFAGEVAYRQEGAFAANFAVRSLNKHSYSFGAWISPEVGDTLQLTLGGTVATGKLWEFNGDKGWSDRKNEWGLDLRMRFQVSDDLSITTLNNLSSGVCVDDKKDANGNALLGKNVGLLWNMLNATYAFADNLWASFTLQSEADVFCPIAKDSTWDLILSPSLIIQASERVRVSTSVRAEIPNLRDYALKQINLTIPVIFTFNY